LRAAQRQRQARVGHHAAAQRDRAAAAFGQAAPGILHRPDLAVGHHRDGHGLADPCDAVPVGRRPVPVQLGAAVHHQLGRAGGHDDVHQFWLVQQHRA
jgi:hypothetical protein